MSLLGPRKYYGKISTLIESAYVCENTFTVFYLLTKQHKNPLPQLNLYPSFVEKNVRIFIKAEINAMLNSTSFHT